MDQRTVNFFSEETRMEGDLFLPSDLKANERRPGVVLCHGFTGVRSLILGDYAKIFAEAGFVFVAEPGVNSQLAGDADVVLYVAGVITYEVIKLRCCVHGPGRRISE